MLNIDLIYGAIFDMDGTMLDSMPIWETVAEDYLISQGLTPRPDLNDDLIKLGGHEIPLYFQVEYGIKKSVREIHAGLYQLLEEFYFYRAPLKDGVLDVLELLRARGIKMCVATATDRWLVEPALERCGIISFFSRIFTCKEENTSKSKPDIYQRACGFLGTPVSATLVFEDAPYAVKSAKSAGFPVIAVYDRSADDQVEEMKAMSDCYFYSLAEMLELL